jgi:tRNA (guanine37-N1)-methyltransferase
MMDKKKKFYIDIITIFPEIFDSFLREALISRAQEKGIVKITAHNLRKWTTDNHKTVDGRPYGGGAGMVLMVEPILKAVDFLKKKNKAHVVVFSAKGKKFTQAVARKWAKKKRIILICGRYEGIDERVNKYIADEEISIGDYVLFGGEVPAMVVTEAVVRLLPGAVGKQKSIEDESFKEVRGIEGKMMTEFIEYPHFTRPEKIKINGKIRAVPKVLLSGNHKDVEIWREAESNIMAKNRRPDLKK